MIYSLEDQPLAVSGQLLAKRILHHFELKANR